MFILMPNQQCQSTEKAIIQFIISEWLKRDTADKQMYVNEITDQCWSSNAELRHVRCNLQVTLCDPYLSALSVR